MASAIVAVIPVRYGSSRFPGKPLALLLQKPMVSWVIEGVSQSSKIAKTIVATDHEEIAQASKKSGAQVVMTDSELPSGSDRVWAAVKDVDCDIVINVQGDEPLMSAQVLDQLIQSTQDHPEADIWTLSSPIHLEELSTSHAVKVVSDKNGMALYFSRFEIPYSRKQASGENLFCQKHIGVYAYRKSALEQFCAHGPSELETCESLEQLRALWMGLKIHVTPVNYESQGVDVPEDIEVVENLLRQREVRSE